MNALQKLYIYSETKCGGNQINGTSTLGFKKMFDVTVPHEAESSGSRPHYAVRLPAVARHLSLHDLPTTRSAEQIFWLPLVIQQSARYCVFLFCVLQTLHSKSIFLQSYIT